MNLFNRVVVILSILALTVTMIVVAVLPEQALRLLQTTLDSMVITTFDRIILIVITALTAIVSVLIIFAEIRPERTKGVKLSQVKGGVAELSTESIAGRIRQATETIPDVRQVMPSVVSHGRSIDVTVTLLANPGVDVSRKASEVMQVVRELVERDIGVKLGKLRANIKYDTVPAQQAQKA